MRKLYILIILILNCLSSLQSTPIDSLKWELIQIDSHKNPDTWFQVAFDLGQALFDKPDYEAALKCYQDVLVLANRLENKSARHKATLQIAHTFRRQGKHESSIKYAQQVLGELPKDSFYLKGLALRLISSNQIRQGNYSEGYKAQMEALQIYTNLKDSALIARIQFGIGGNFFYQEQYDLALEYYQKALSISEQIHLEKGIFQAYKAIGSVFDYQDKLEKALTYSEKALEMVSLDENPHDYGWTLLNIGSLQCRMENYQEGIKKLEKTLDLSIEMGEKPLEGYCLEILASVAKDRKQYKKALEYLQQSYDIARSTNDRSNIGVLYKNFSDIHFETGDYVKYKYYMEQHQALKDSLYNEKLIDELSSLKQDFAVQQVEKEKKIALLEKEKELQQVELNYSMGIAVAGSLIVFLILWMMYQRNKNQKEKNQLLYRKNQEFLRQNEMLLSSNQDLEKYAFIISHDLKEPLRNISGFTTLIQRKLKQIADPQIHEYMNFVINNASQMHLLLGDLLQYSQIGSKNELDTEPIETNELLTETLTALKAVIPKDAQIIVENLPTVFYNKTHLFQVFYHLLSNALKFCSQKPIFIQIQSVEDEHFYTFSVSDNGMGIAPEYHEQIFIVFKRLHERGKFTGSGIGLSTCKKIVEKYGGSISVESELGGGTTFYFSVPKSSQFVNEP